MIPRSPVLRLRGWIAAALLIGFGSVMRIDCNSAVAAQDASSPSATSFQPQGPLPFKSSEVRSAFDDHDFNWYDGKGDKTVPVLSWPDINPASWSIFKGTWFQGWFKGWGQSWRNPFRGWFNWLNVWRIPFLGGLGDLIVIGLALLFFTLLVVGLLELLRRYRPTPAPSPVDHSVKIGGSVNIEGLPAGVPLDEGDPWQEALRRRAIGDYAAAIVYLFAHQLITLERLRQVRLVPGRTARQLIRTVGDRNLRDGVEPTLQLFELVYYGQRVPTADAFERVWALAEGFEKRRLEGGTA